MSRATTRTESNHVETQDLASLLQIGHATNRGKQREINEDRYCAVDLIESEAYPVSAKQGCISKSKLDCLVAVADGMGGHAKGEVASTYSIRQLLDLFVENRYRQWASSAGIGEEDLLLILKEAFHEINAKIYDTSIDKPDHKGMGTTLTAALLRIPHLYVCHVGDSRAYLLRGSEMRTMTNDHSWVAEQIRKGLLDENDPKVHKFSNYITQAIGTAPTVHVDSIEFEIQDCDLIFLCTDGLYDLVLKDEIKSALLSWSPQKACDKLVKLANKRGGHDNITCIALKVKIVESSPCGCSELPKRSKVRKWIICVIILVLLGLTLGILYWRTPNIFDFLWNAKIEFLHKG